MTESKNSDLLLCELENANLRRLLAWAATKLDDGDRGALAAMLDSGLDHGGVTSDTTEEDREEYVKVKDLLVALAAHVDLIMESEETPSSWYDRAEGLLEQARAYEPKNPLQPTLLEARNP